MMESVPASAPWKPPETGASSMATPRSASAAAKRRVSTGDIELMSSRMLPGRIASARPGSPKSTASTSGVSGSMVMTTSAFAAFVMEPARTAPSATSASTAAWFRSCTAGLKPALSRFAAMGRPMTPSPMNPMLSDRPLSVFIR